MASSTVFTAKSTTVAATVGSTMVMKDPCGGVRAR